jgi:peptidyl-prolyl cis-trans isomerase C
VTQLHRSFLPIVALLAWFTPVSAQTIYPPDTVVAERGGAVVTMLDVDAAMLAVPPRMRANVMNNPKRIEELIDRLLINRQLAMEGHAAGVDKGSEFKQAVKQQEERLLTELHLTDMRTNLDIGDAKELARERYEVNPAAYALPGATSARHILIATKSRTDETAKALADSVHAKVLAGEDFTALVKEYSDDPSKANNEGLIPGADSDSMDPAFAEAVKQLKNPGDVSAVVKSRFGYHIIKLEGRIPPKPRSFEQVKDKIVSELETSMRDARVKEHVDQLKGMEIKATPDVVASLRTRYLPKGAQAEPAIPEKK